MTSPPTPTSDVDARAPPRRHASIKDVCFGSSSLRLRFASARAMRSAFASARAMFFASSASTSNDGFGAFASRARVESSPRDDASVSVCFARTSRADVNIARARVRSTSVVVSVGYESGLDSDRTRRRRRRRRRSDRAKTKANDARKGKKRNASQIGHKSVTDRDARAYRGVHASASLFRLQIVPSGSATSPLGVNFPTTRSPEPSF